MFNCFLFIHFRGIITLMPKGKKNQQNNQAMRNPCQCTMCYEETTGSCMFKDCWFYVYRFFFGFILSPSD